MIKLNSPKNHQILAFFFLNPKRRLYLKEIADILEIDNGNLSRYLNSLSQEGVLKTETEGRQKYFSLNTSYPLLKELKKIIAPSVKPEYLLANVLAQIEGLESAYIFGSYVSGDFNKNSDIDLLLVGRHDLIDVRERLLPIQRSLGREINIVDYSPQEYREKLTKKDEFLARVLQGEKIVLK
jgi:predicted nucleotidyltransferase